MEEKRVHNPSKPIVVVSSTEGNERNQFSSCQVSKEKHMYKPKGRSLVAFFNLDPLKAEVLYSGQFPGPKCPMPVLRNRPSTYLAYSKHLMNWTGI